MRTMTKIMAAGYLTLAVAGCGFADEETDEPVDDAECVDCGDNDWPIGETEIPEQLPDQPCAPRPVAEYPANLPELPDGVFDATCPLEREVMNRSDRHDRETIWQWNGDTVEVRHVIDEQLDEKIEFEFANGDDHPTRIEQRDYRSNTYIDADERITVERWEFDARGRLIVESREVLDRYGDDTQRVSRDTSEQIWAGDLLVERVETSEGRNSGQTRYDWNYDTDGRLLEATYEEDGEIVATTDWTYETGRPVMVERRESGELVERQIWTYDDEGRVAARQFHHRPEIIANHVAANRNFDTYGDHPRYLPAKMSNAHLRASPGDECYQLPSSLGHGYPADEDAYAFHWGGLDIYGDATERGLNSYIHHWEVLGDYGLSTYPTPGTGFYGHLGASTDWSNSPFVNFSAVDGHLLYDESGRMIDEHLEIDSGEKTIELDRNRQFGPDGIERDYVELRRGDDTVDAELRFERNDSELVRTRLRDGAVMASQTWTFDGDDAVELDIYIQPNLEMGPRPITDLFSDYDAAEPVHSATYQRRFDDENQLAETKETRFVLRHEQYHRTYGEHGIVEEVRRRGSRDGKLEIQRRNGWSYDDNGELVHEWIDRGDDGELDRETVYKRDGDGRLLERHGYESSNRVSTTRRTFQCE